MFPNIMSLIFNYNDSYTITVGPGNTSVKDYRANSLNDPDLAVGGGRPRYFDTFLGANNTSAPYRRYTVVGCDAFATVSNQSAVHLYAALSMYSNQATAPSTLQEAKERSDTVVRIIPPLGGNSVCKLRMKRSIARILGVKDMLDNPDMKSDFNANPAALVVCRLTVFNPYSAATESYSADVSIRYDSRLFVRNDVADS
jgi:hypothetical protein